MMWLCRRSLDGYPGDLLARKQADAVLASKRH
jgi:hypothetical protein